MKVMSLVEAPIDIDLKIKDIVSGKEAKMKLFQMGFHIDDSLIRMNKNSWGPVLIKNISNGNIMVALGRNLAEKILVDYAK